MFVVIRQLNIPRGNRKSSQSNRSLNLIQDNLTKHCPER
jgi:hypothetical protein